MVKGLPSSDSKANGMTLHAVASFRTKALAKEHAKFKRSHGQYARVVNRTGYGSQGGWWVYTAYKPRRT